MQGGIGVGDDLHPEKMEHHGRQGRSQPAKVIIRVLAMIVGTAWSHLSDCVQHRFHLAKKPDMRELPKQLKPCGQIRRFLVPTNSCFRGERSNSGRDTGFCNQTVSGVHRCIRQGSLIVNSLQVRVRGGSFCADRSTNDDTVEFRSRSERMTSMMACHSYSGPSFDQEKQP